MLEKDQLFTAIDLLQEDYISPQEAEQRMLPILITLLGIDGFSVTHTGGIGDQGIDFFAEKEDQKIAIQQKHYSSPNRSVGVSDLHQMLGSMVIQRINRVIMVSNTKFSKQTREWVKQNKPISFELIDIDALKAWGARLSYSNEESQKEAIRMIADLSQHLALLIAKDPKVLHVVEWRDLERLLAEVFSGLGFSVTLTPSSKDGGKDLILECLSNETNCSYIVEIKHWRSGQKVGSSSISEFLKVVLKENRNAGIFLSTFGYCDNAFEHLTEIDREKVRIGDQTKVISLCQRYSRVRSGIWSPVSNLPEILFEQTC